MGLSRLAAKCQVCPFVSTCGHKRMEEVGYLVPSVPVEQSSMDILQGSTAVDQVIRAAQRPFEESVRTYLTMIERGLMTVQEVSKMRNLK